MSRRALLSLLLAVTIHDLPSVNADDTGWSIPREIAFPTVVGIGSVYFVMTLALLSITIAYGNCRSKETQRNLRRRCISKKRLPVTVYSPRSISGQIGSDFIFSNLNAELDDVSTTSCSQYNLDRESTFTAEKCVGLEESQLSPGGVSQPERATATQYHSKPDEAILSYHLSLVAYKWRRIGEELGLDPHNLDMIKTQSKSDMTCLKRMCKMWAYSTPHGSWVQVVAAVERCQEPELAKQIATIHCS